MKKLLFILSLACFGRTSAQVCFNPFVDYLVGSYPNGIISADFNGDGNPDLAISNGTSNNISILLGTGGTGSFGTATNFPVNGTNPSLVSADFNGDGNVDIATANVFFG